MDSFLLTVVAAVLVFSAVILIHELGHFLVAKASGIKVNEFSLGMGPLLFKFQKGETQYSVRLLPVGGYVSMEGEDEDSPDPRSFQRAPVGRRILVTVAGAVMNLLLGFAVLIAVVCMQDSILSRTVGAFYPGAATEAQAIEEVKLRTRQYAKRQLTWLRRNPDIHWIYWEKERDFERALQISTEILTAAGVC